MLSKKDYLVMTYLRKNARMTLTNMSRQTKLPVSTIFDRLRFYKENLILKTTALLNYPKLGFHARAYLMLKTGKNDRDSVRDFLMNNRNTNSLFKINNGFDFLAECIFKNINELECFLESLEERYVIKNKHIYYIIEDLKREEFMSNPSILEMIKL